MQSGLSPARQVRVRYRHELRSLTYVMLDQANGGIIRNLTHDGIAVQAVGALRAGQRLRVRFELPHRLRIEASGEVVWARPTGQCGIRLLDLSPRIRRRVDEWILGALLENATPHPPRAPSMFRTSRTVTGPLFGLVDEKGKEGRLRERPDERSDGNDGLILSPAAVKVIALPDRSTSMPEKMGQPAETSATGVEPAELDWLSQPLSSRGIAWSVNTLAVLAGLLLFALVFLSVTRESPRWPAEMVAGAAVFVAAFYWGFFKLFGGPSPGARLARLAGYGYDEEKSAEGPRFR